VTRVTIINHDILFSGYVFPADCVALLQDTGKKSAALTAVLKGIQQFAEVISANC
jgi:hypothetical protein